MSIFHLIFIFFKTSMNVTQAVVSSMVVKEHVIILTEVISAVVQPDITLYQMEKTVQVKWVFPPVFKLWLYFRKTKVFRFVFFSLSK